MKNGKELAKKWEMKSKLQKAKSAKYKGKFPTAGASEYEDKMETAKSDVSEDDLPTAKSATDKEPMPKAKSAAKKSIAKKFEESNGYDSSVGIDGAPFNWKYTSRKEGDSSSKQASELQKASSEGKDLRKLIKSWSK